MKRVTQNRCAWLLALALVAGCSAPRSSAGDGAVGDDGLLEHDSLLTSGRWKFVAAAAPTEPAVLVHLVQIDGDQATVDVVVQGVPQIQAIAYRLRYDVARLQVAESYKSELWSAPSVARFAPRADGELWAGIGHIGLHTVSAGEMVSVSRHLLKLDGADPIALDFIAHRGQLLGKDMQSVAAKWVGGRFERGVP